MKQSISQPLISARLHLPVYGRFPPLHPLMSVLRFKSQRRMGPIFLRLWWDCPLGQAAVTRLSVRTTRRRSEILQLSPDLGALVAREPNTTQSSTISSDFERDLELDYNLDNQASKSMRGGSIAVVGGPTVELKSAGRLTLRRMAPGEDRWVRTRFGDVNSDYASQGIIRFNEVANGNPVSGFAIGYQREPLPLVRLEVLRMEADVLGRLFAIAHDPEVGQRAQEATRMIQKSPHGIESQPFRALEVGVQKTLRETIKRRLSSKTGGDFFRLREALATLPQGTQIANEERLLVAHEVLAQRLDAYLTRVQRRTR